MNVLATGATKGSENPGRPGFNGLSTPHLNGRGGPTAMRAPVLLLLLALAGCVAPGATPEPADVAPTLSFGEGVAALACADDCFEPTLAVDAQGRFFATTQRGLALARSLDGVAWEAVAPPPAPEGAPPQVPDRGPTALGGVSLGIANVADGTLQTDREGRLFYSALVGGAQGVQVARSDDAGQTWAVNSYVSLLRDPTVPAPGIEDRQWLGFGPDGVVYLTFSQIPTGLWIARSDDGGATFGAWNRFAPIEDRQTIGYESLPVVDAAGRVLIAYPVGPPASANPATPYEWQVVLARSEDGGATWATTVVHTVAGRPTSSSSTMLAESPDGSLHVTWIATEGPLLLARSDDGGDTWSEPLVLDEAPDAALVPWIASSARGVAVAWHDAQHDLRVWRDGVSAVAASVGHPDSHYAWLAPMPDGRMATVHAAESAVVVAVESA